MAGSTFAVKRMVCDHVHLVGSIDHVDVGNKQCCCAVRVLSTNTPLTWKTRKKHRSKVVAGEKRKAVSDEVSELKVKRRAQQIDAEALSASADDFSDQTEKLQKLPLLAKANGMQRAAREKANQVKALNQLIDNKLLELENCL